jgi:putative polymerase
MSSALSALVLIAAVCFNAVLSIINGHVMALARVHVVLAEMAIYAGALAIIVFRSDRNMWPWFLLALLIVLMGLLIALGNGEFNPKYIRDVLVIPIFIMLGMTYHTHRFTTPFLILHGIVFGICMLEIASPDTYANVFKVLDYYVNTRDFSSNQFWNTESTLFVSATRPGARFFGFVDWHRASSIFLEPVSLGNYCVIAAILTLASWAELTRTGRLYLIGSTLFLLVACDGRLAAASIGIVVVAGLLLRNISSRWSVLYLPGSLVAATGYVLAFRNGPITDSFIGRVTGTVDALSYLDFSGLVGMAAATAERAADNGIVYFILTQSLIGVAVIWVAVCLLMRGHTPQGRTYMHAIAIFIPLNLLVSYSFFSIKVASVMWFAYGLQHAKDFGVEAHQPYRAVSFPGQSAA